MSLIQSKPISSKRKIANDIRIAVMRRIKPEHEFDLWFPVLSPSAKLVQEYAKDKKISWEEFTKKFLIELKKNEFYLKYIVSMAKDRNVSLLCYEEDGKYCHRRILLDKIKELFPNQKIKYD